MIKRIIYILLAFVFAGCLNKEDISNSSNDKIMLDFALDGEVFTKSGSTPAFESTVNHIDIYLFKSSDNTRIFYERKYISGTSSGSTVLNGITLEELKEIGKVSVYVVANSSLPEEQMESKATVSALKNTTETTTFINITGYTGFEEDYPDTFLMTGETEDDFSGIDISENQTIDITLVRAAAKVEIHFKKGNNASIHSFGKLNDGEYSYEDNSYYIRNLRYVTPFWGEATSAKRKTNPLTNSGYMVPDKSNGIDEVVVTTYIYSCSWGGTDNSSSIFEDAPFLVVNLPVMVAGNQDGELVYNQRNYYEIPLRTSMKEGESSYKIQRNHHYIITATVDAPGAQTDMEPVELVPVYYKAFPWNNKNIEIGGEVTDVNYLNLSSYAIEMHNTFQNSEIKFASSAPIQSVTLKEAYYINKYGNKVSVNYPAATADNDVLNGKITVNSQLSPTIGNQKIDNVAIYMTFEVSNGTNTKQFTVTQYPTVYIQGVLGSFSYREDFGANWADGRGANGYVSTQYSNNRWNYYSTHTQYTTFQSKKAGDQINAQGQATMRYYYWERNGWKNSYTIKYQDYHSGNPRMYHITITSTSEDYHIGRPKLNGDGYTDSGSDNLVSPSFMIASSLGAVSSFTNLGYDVAAYHCKNYAEAYYDSNNNLVKLEDWRLPTTAEIGILVKFQQNSVAMDEIITGEKYMTASGGAVATGISGANSGIYVRCVRDAYTTASN